MFLKPFGTIKGAVLQNRWYILAGMVSLLVVDVMQLLIPLVIKAAIDTLTRGIESSAPLLRLAAGIVIIAALIVVFRFIWRYCIIGTSRRIEMDLRGRLFSHCVRLPLKTLLHTTTGDLMARMTNDLEAVRMCAGIGLVALVDTVFLGIASISFMMYISPSLTLACLTPMVVIVFATWLLSSQVHKRFARVQAAFSVLTEKVRETLAGITVIKAYVLENSNLDSFSSISRDYVDKNLGLIKILGLFFPLIMFFANLSIGILLLYGGRLTLFSHITPGDFVAFASYLWILTWPMMALGWIVNLYQRGAASMIRINGVLDNEHEMPQQTEAPRSVPADGAIEINNLTFSYEYGTTPALQNISLSIPPGTTVGITGKTGSGKSTLCNLLLRLFSVPDKSIYIDGRDVNALTIPELRAAFSYVPQDSFLFSDTISENIAFGVPDAPAADIQHLAETVQISNEIQEFNEGFDTVIGERGITLSGGQKQRLCIARALLKQAPVLILDDCLSSLDASTTESIILQLKQAARQRTTLIVSHRVAAIQHADIILVLSDGIVEQQGTHEELIDREGLYYELYLKQKLEQEAV